MAQVLQNALDISHLVSNVRAQLRKAHVAEIEPPIQMAGATIISKKNMKTNYLFAIDPTSNDILISESAKGSFKINLVERIPSTSDDLLFDAVKLLTNVSKQPDLDVALFKAVEKVCQVIYSKRNK